MRRLPGFVFVCTVVASCGGPSDPSAPVQRIIGNERLGWDQMAATVEEVASLSFVAYVDGARSGMQDVSCATSLGPAGFACNAKLPAMAPGRHSLRLAAVSGNDSSLESDQSTPLQVIVVSGTSALTLPGAAQAVTEARTRAVTTIDGVRLRLDVVTDGLRDPTDLAVLTDGRILVAERGGTVRLVRPDRPQDVQWPPALTLGDIDVNLVARGHAGLLALAPDPRFDRNGFVYIVYVSAAGFRLARFREAGDVLGDRVILLDGVAASSAQSSAALRFGPDAKLYLGLDDGGDAVRAGDLGSFNGKVLRLNDDATTPADQAGGTPVYVLDVNAPRGIEWGAVGGPLWIAQAGPGGKDGSPGELRAVVPADDRPARTRVAVRYLLPAGIEPSQLVLYHGSLIPAFQGDLLMAGGDGGGLLRVRFDSSDPLKVISAERLLDDAGRFRSIAAAPDGAIYLTTSTALMKMAPAAPVQ